MMSEGDRLCSLKVGVARHNRVAVFLSLARDNLNQLNNELLYIYNLFFEVKLYVKRDLIVTAARGVESFSVVADSLCELALDESVDILSLHVNLQRAAFDIRENTL